MIGLQVNLVGIDGYSKARHDLKEAINKDVAVIPGKGRPY